MAYTNQIAVMRIQRDLITAEDTIDQAMAAVASLSATLLEARVGTSTPSSLGHEVLMRLTKAQSSLVNTRGDMLRVHGELLDIGKVTMMPDIHENCPPKAAAIAIAEAA